MNIYERLNIIFRDVFDDEAIEVNPQTNANDIEDWDSLAQINLIVAIKAEFEINFNLEEVASYQNVGDMVEAIKQKTGLQE